MIKLKGPYCFLSMITLQSKDRFPRRLKLLDEQLIQLHVEDPNEAVMLLGISDQNMKLIEEALNISILTRGDTISLSGEEENRDSAKSLLEQLLKVIRKGININQRDVSTAIEMVKSGTIEYFAELYDEEIARNSKRKAIRAKTIGQREYVHAIRKKDLYFVLVRLELEKRIWRLFSRFRR